MLGPQHVHALGDREGDGEVVDRREVVDLGRAGGELGVATGGQPELRVGDVAGLDDDPLAVDLRGRGPRDRSSIRGSTSATTVASGASASSFGIRRAPMKPGKPVNRIVGRAMCPETYPARAIDFEAP